MARQRRNTRSGAARDVKILSGSHMKAGVLRCKFLLKTKAHLAASMIQPNQAGRSVSKKHEKSEVRGNSREQRNLKQKEEPKPVPLSRVVKCVIDNCSVNDTFLKPYFFREHPRACLRRGGSRDEQRFFNFCRENW